jgi:hypothetical protein
MDLRIERVLGSAATVALVLIAGPARAQDSELLGPAPAGGDVRRFDVSPDGHWAVYVDGFVHGVKVSGGEKERLLDPRPEVDPPVLGHPSFRISPDSRRVVYGALDGTARLASVPIDGSAPPVDLHGAIGEYAITPDSRRVVLRALTSTPARIWSRSRSTGRPGRGAPRQQPARRLRGDAGRTRVVYTVRTSSGGGLLWCAPLDASAPSLLLNSGATAADPTGSYLLLIPPDGGRVVYRRGTLQTIGDLFSVPLDGSSGPVQLNAPGFYNVSWIRTTMPRFAPDGRSIAYTEEIDFREREHRLFVAPVDGSTPAVGLSTSLGIDGVFAWEFIDDGADVLFVHANFYDAQLYRCSSDGTEVPHSLSAPIPETWYFKVPPGGTRAVFTATPAGAPFGLWSVPIDSSGAPLGSAVRRGSTAAC